MASQQNTSVRLDGETHKVLKSVALWQGMTMGEIVELAVKQYVKDRPELEDRVRMMIEAGLLND